MKDKRVLALTIIAVLVIVTLIISSSFAFFALKKSSTQAGSGATITAEDPGTVTISKSSDIKLNLTNALMVDKGSDVTYYGSTSGTPSTSATNVSIATVSSVSGVTKNCSYTLSLSSTGDFLTAYKGMSNTQAGDFVLTVGGQSYDFKTASLPSTISGTISNLLVNTPQNINAQLKFINRSGKDQTALAGKNLSITFNITAFSCTVAS